MFYFRITFILGSPLKFFQILLDDRLNKQIKINLVKLPKKSSFGQNVQLWFECLPTLG